MISQEDIDAMRPDPQDAVDALAYAMQAHRPAVKEDEFQPLAVQASWLQWYAYSLQALGWRGTAEALLKAGGFKC